MVRNAFSVFDEKACIFAQPFWLVNKGEAIRSFEDACKDDKIPFKAHPSDYKLYLLGSFDDVSGLLSPRDVPEYIVSASDFVAK
jgi:hypothetical protein